MKTEKKTPAKAQTKASDDIIIDLTHSSDAESMDAEAIPGPAAREGVAPVPASLDEPKICLPFGLTSVMNAWSAVPVRYLQCCFSASKSWMLVSSLTRFWGADEQVLQPILGACLDQSQATASAGAAFTGAASEIVFSMLHSADAQSMHASHPNTHQS